ncbi:MAG TPA: glycosyltransferase [Burkholderiales bacterium]|nr:glycosyltransferase [Burkholderiales bacterium]
MSGVQRDLPSGIGVVVIGRNEGERLRRCCESLAGAAAQVVYVDSGSTDGSVAMVERMGFAVVELDLNVPFTAGRARNEGFRRLRALVPGLRYVQFLDGDCTLAAGWLTQAIAFLDAHPGVAVVCGRRRERHPQQSVYNLLCDMEWDTPVGEAKACGGDALMRADAFDAAGGFRADLIAGEEPELCVRLRARGGRIWRLDAEMTLHDAAMTRFRQWWTRMMRGGYAYAEAADLHGRPPERQGVRESRSIWFWALVVPALAAAVAAFSPAWGAAVLLLYPLQAARLALRSGPWSAASWYRAAFLVLGKFPEWLGQLRYLRRRHLGWRAQLIEYK